MNDIPDGSGIYRITCTITGMFYIGSSKGLRKRYQSHFGELRRKEHRNSKLQRAFDKYTESAFIFEVLELVLPAFLIEREQYWLDKLQPFGKKGFNIDRIAGSTRLGYTFSPESREKMRLSHLGQVSHMRGKKHSPEALAKMSAARKGKPSTRVGYKASPETLAKQRGRNVSQETRAKLSEANLGKKHTDEIRAKISAAGLGRKMSPAAREKIGIAKQGNTNSAKSYVVTSPEGIEYVVYNLKAFCRERNLTPQVLSLVATGKRSHHKGWTARSLESA